MTAQDSNLKNWFSTVLTAQMGATDLTATVAATSGMTSPGYLTIEPDSATQREVVYFDGTFTGTTFVVSHISKRYLTGSAAASGLVHPAGSVVECRAVQQHFEDLHDRIDAVSAATTTEVLQDLVGAMVTGNTETGITVTYQDSDGTIDFVLTSSSVRTLAKVADETRSVSGATSDDAELTLTVTANTTYRVDALLYWNSTPSPDAFVNWTFPAAATLIFAGLGPGGVWSGNGTTDNDRIYSLNGASSDEFVLVAGTLVVGANAGYFTLQWSPSGAGDLTLKAGSWLSLTEAV